MMKKRDLERALRALGWELLRHGGNHDIWIHQAAGPTEKVPRHREVNERLAEKILRDAQRVNDAD
jgi:predicted RNA binding protein YcfA (HicA-like mRNA interferase family)